MDGRINFVKAFFLLALLAGFASAAGPALQVTAHSTVPVTLYPGTNGQLQVTVLNAGTDTATGVSAQYTISGMTSSIYPGDIGAGASSIFSVPFGVPQDFNSGFMVIYLNIYYQSPASSSTTGGVSTGVSYKSTQVSVPLEISQHQVLSIETSSVQPGAITPGDSFTAKLKLVNSGGVVNNVIISSSNNSQFALQGTTQLSADDVPFNSSKEVSVRISSSSSTASGKYTVPIIVTYQDSLQNTQTETAYIGPVTVYDSSSQFKVELAPLSPVEVGSQVPFTLTLENLGGSSSSAFVDFNSSAVFTPIGSTRVYFDPIEPGQAAAQTVTLGVQATSSAGYYVLPLSITGNGRTYTQDIGIVVDATPELAITAQTSQAASANGAGGTGGAQAITMSIANTGNSPIRSVYASAASSGGLRVVGTPDKFIGTLNVDDFATFQVNVMAASGNGTRAGAATGQTPQDGATLPVTIVFKDSKNQQHTITKNVQIGSAAASFAAGASGSGNFAGRRTNGGLFGLDTPATIALAAAVLVVAFVGYKRWKHEKIEIKIPFFGAKKK